MEEKTFQDYHLVVFWENFILFFFSIRIFGRVEDKKKWRSKQVEMSFRLNGILLFVPSSLIFFQIKIYEFDDRSIPFDVVNVVGVSLQGKHWIANIFGIFIVFFCRCCFFCSFFRIEIGLNRMISSGIFESINVIRLVSDNAFSSTCTHRCVEFNWGCSTDSQWTETVVDDKIKNCLKRNHRRQKTEPNNSSNQKWQRERSATVTTSAQWQLMKHVRCFDTRAFASIKPTSMATINKWHFDTFDIVSLLCKLPTGKQPLRIQNPRNVVKLFSFNYRATE